MTTIIKQRKNPYYQVFRPFHADNGRDGRNIFAPLNIIENENVYKIQLNLAGWGKEDIDIRLEDERLIISGEKKSDSTDGNEKYHVREYQSNRFFRSVILNDEINQDDIQAELKDGILTVTVSKIPAEELNKSKKIEIH